MHSIELTDEELRVVHAALRAFLDDVLRLIKGVIAKLPPATRPE